MVTFDEIQNAFSFVSSDEYGMNRAVLCFDNCEIYLHSKMGTFDELDEDKFDCDNFVVIPHKNDLDLGQRLVFDFAEQHLPDDLARSSRSSAEGEPTEGSKTSWSRRNSCKAGTISRTREMKKRCMSGSGKTRSS